MDPNYFQQLRAAVAVAGPRQPASPQRSKGPVLSRQFHLRPDRVSKSDSFAAARSVAGVVAVTRTHISAAKGVNSGQLSRGRRDQARSSARSRGWITTPIIPDPRSAHPGQMESDGAYRVARQEQLELRDAVAARAPASRRRRLKTICRGNPPSSTARGLGPHSMNPCWPGFRPPIIPLFPR